MKAERTTVIKDFEVEVNNIPIMTSNSDQGNTVSMVSGSLYGGSTDYYKAFGNPSEAQIQPSSNTSTVRYTFGTPLKANDYTSIFWYSSDTPKYGTTTYGSRTLYAYTITLNYTDGTTETVVSWSGSLKNTLTFTDYFTASKPFSSIDYYFSGNATTNTNYVIGVLYDFQLYSKETETKEVGVCKVIKKPIYDYYKIAIPKYTQPVNPTGITATSGWENPKNAFDQNSSTYARCNSKTDYIEWDLGQTIYLNGINTTGNWVNSTAVATNFKVYSVDENGNETFICETAGASNTGTYTTNAKFAPVEVNKLRFYITITFSGAPSRTTEISLSTEEKIVKGTADDYDFYKDMSTYYAVNER